MSGMNPKTRMAMQIGIAVVIGIFICWIDSRPNWDDSGITAGMIFLSTAILGFVSPRYAYVWGLSVGIWIPLVGILLDHNFGSLIALVVAMGGAYVGAVISKAIKKQVN